MIVIDASAVIELLLASSRGARIRKRIVGQHLHAPHLIDVEVAHIARKLWIGKHLTVPRLATLLADFRAMRLARYEHVPLLERIWELRNNVTSYDAAYVALAETLGATLLTLDGPLSRSKGHKAAIEAFPLV